MAWQKPTIVKEAVAELDYSPMDPVDNGVERLTLPAIVYTTKLDDMKTLERDLRKYSNREVTNMILSESKPRYSPKHVTSNSNLFSNSDIMSYIKVALTIRHIYDHAAYEDQNLKENQAKLQQLCKPCSVVLRDLKTYTQKEIDQQIKPTSAKKIRKSPIHIFDDDNDDSLLQGNRKSGQDIIPKDRKALLVLVHNNTTAFIYRIDIKQKTVTDYLLMSPYKIAKLKEMFPTDHIYIRLYCCWYSRENILRLLPGELSIPFLRQSHNCDLGKCQCCCFKKDCESYDNTNSKKIIYEKQNAMSVDNNWFSVAINNNQCKSNAQLICKAMCYKPNKYFNNSIMQDKVELDTKDPKVKLKTLIRIENKNMLKTRGIEFYEIDHNTNVISLNKVDNDNDASKIENMYKLTGVQPILKECCCWYSRRNIISELKMQYSSKLLTFMEFSHICDTFGFCQCCCKSQRNQMSLRVRIKKKEWTYTHWPAVINHTTAYNRNALNINISKKTDIKLANQRKVYESDVNNELTKKLTPEKVEVPSSVNVNTYLKKPSHSFIMPKAKSDDIFIDKFKKLKVNVNKRGELEAVLDSPARELSVLELKVLYKILERSSEQIKKVHISPEDFCDRVKSNEISTATQTEVSELTKKQARNLSSNKTRPKPHKQNNQDKTESAPICGEISNYQELSRLMKVKNSFLAIACASHFKKDNQQVSMPIFRSFNPISEIPMMPVIVNSYELKMPAAKKNTDNSIQADMKSNVGNLSNSKRKRNVAPTLSQPKKRLRLKSPSKLIEVNTTDAPVIRPADPITITGNPNPTNVVQQDNAVTDIPDNNLNNQPLLPNPANNEFQAMQGNNPKLPLQTPVLMVPNNVHRPNVPRPITLNDTILGVAPDHGTRWVSVRPLMLSDSLLKKLLKAPQVSPFKDSSGNVNIPSLVPIDSPSNSKLPHVIVPAPSTSSAVPDDTVVDVEQSIQWNLVVDKNSKNIHKYNWNI